MKMKVIIKKISLVLILSLLGFVFWGNYLIADEDLEDIDDSSKNSRVSSSSSSNNDYEVILSTDFNFSETSILGNMKTPDGFYLQGNKAQDLKDMVKLRSSFKQELLDSYSGVELEVK